MEDVTRHYTVFLHDLWSYGAAIRKVRSMKDYTEFVQAWQASHSISDAMQRVRWTGTRQSFIVTASKLRKKGVPLKKFKDSGPRSAVHNTAHAWDDATRDDQFIEIWQTSLSAAEVAERFGISAGYASVKAHRLRKSGVSLKRYKSGVKYSYKVNQRACVKKAKRI